MKYAWSAVVLTAAFFIVTTLPAQAGFNWTPPSNVKGQTQQPAQEDAPPAVPAPPVEQALTPEPNQPLPVVPPASQPGAKAGMNTINMLQKAEGNLISQQPVAPPQTQAETDVMVLEEQALTPELSQQSQSELPVPTGDSITWNATQQTAEPVAESVPAPIVYAPPVIEQPVAPAPVQTQAPQAFPVVEGFGENIPLVMAMRQIVPASYAYQFQNNNDAGLKVTWEGGRPWTLVLHDALSPLGLQAYIAAGKVIIASARQYNPMISARPGPMTAEQAYWSTVPGQSEPAVVQTEANFVKPVIVSRNTRNWQARPGMTLRETLEDWGKLSGYELDWQTPYDYPIDTAFRYEGSIDQALDSILSLYAQDHPKPRGKLYPNMPDGPSVLVIN